MTTPSPRELLLKAQLAATETRLAEAKEEWAHWAREAEQLRKQLAAAEATIAEQAGSLRRAGRLLEIRDHEIGALADERDEALARLDVVTAELNALRRLMGAPDRKPEGA